MSLEKGKVAPTTTNGIMNGEHHDYQPEGNHVNIGEQSTTLSAKLANDHPQDEVFKIVCGPLLNYKNTSSLGAEIMWHGTVLIVAQPSKFQPILKLRGGRTSTTGMDKKSPDAQGQKLYEDADKTFWRFQVDVPLCISESRWEYAVSVPNASEKLEARGGEFLVPALDQSMRIMFHSCNGFSVGTDEEAWNGPVLWNDVLRMHDQKPFHVMIGGGDQIYNDGVRVGGPLRKWTDESNPMKRREFPFDEQLRDCCDRYYYDNYIMWYSTGAFARANCQIPQLNVWDDHDIIDGFGSYTDHFMRCAVFRGIGSVAFKYYCLFQHHIPPQPHADSPRSPKSLRNFMSPKGLKHPKSPRKAELNNSSAVASAEEPFVLEEELSSNYIVGKTPGPYISQRSHSLYTELGARIAFLGIDARTERTRHQVNYPETYELILSRVADQLASKPKLNHLIILLGVPIAYPRLAWLETILKSPVIGIVRFLDKRFGLAGNFFNHFDGNVDLLDDLDDHYTARQHKRERRDLLLRLQQLAAKHSVRVTILGGDVHLAALGKFYSSPKADPKPSSEAADPRFMVNIVSSAITNKPPPQLVANMLARRNKIHHLDHHTDETLISLFNDAAVEDPEVKAHLGKKRANTNHLTMPSRNYAIIEEQSTETTVNGTSNGDADHAMSSPPMLSSLHMPSPSIDLTVKTSPRMSPPRALQCAFRVEIDQHDRAGRTYEYPFEIPGLQLNEDERQRLAESAENSRRRGLYRDKGRTPKPSGTRP